MICYTCYKPSPVAAQNSPRWCMQSQHISLLHSYSCRPPAVVPCTSRRLSRGLPPEPRSLPAGWWVTTVNKEHLSSPQCRFPHSYVCVGGHCDPALRVFWGCCTCVCLWVCLCSICGCEAVDPEGWKQVTEGIPPLTLTVIASVCLNLCEVESTP